jgi:hypothetical protein
VIGSRARWAFTAVCLALGGCGNAYEHLSMGDWQEVGRAEPPNLLSNGAFVGTTLVEGSGPTVEAGDLVKANVRSYASKQSQIIWVWTGREPGIADSSQVAADMGTFGYLGSDRGRFALIHRRLHEKFEIRLEEGAVGFADELPLRGIIGSRFATLQVNAYIDGQLAAPQEWSALPLAAEGMRAPDAQIEILNICKAKLLRRTATLHQFGAVFATGDVRYAVRRHGTLGWTAIEAECPAPDGKMRFQAGPFYFRGATTDGSWLADWGASYQRLRRPKEHPEEWQVVREPSRRIINERMAPIVKTDLKEMRNCTANRTAAARACPPG